MSGALFSIPQPTVIYDVDVHWPSSQAALGSNSGFDVNGEYSVAQATGGQNLWSGIGGGGTGPMDYLPGAQKIAGSFVSTGATSCQRLLQGFSAYVPLVAAALPSAGFRYGKQGRLWRWQWIACLKTAYSPNTNVNCVVQPAAGAAPGVFSTNNPGFGIAGDGAGNWQWIARSVAGPGVSETVGLGVAMNAITLFDLVILAATGAGNAIVQLFLNGVYGNPVIQRSFISAGTVLPDYTAVAGAARFVMQIENSDQVHTGTLLVGDVRCMQGAFTPQGAAVL